MERKSARRGHAALTAAGMLLAAGAASAHPHMWIDARAAIDIDEQQRITAVRQVWRFDDMFGAYQGKRSAYWVVTKMDRGKELVIGGGGFAQLTGADDKTCELRKMYFLPELRGLGIGQELLGDHRRRHARPADDQVAHDDPRSSPSSHARSSGEGEEIAARSRSASAATAASASTRSTSTRPMAWLIASRRSA